MQKKLTMDTCTIFLAAALERKWKSKLEYMMSLTRFLRPNMIFMNTAKDYSSGAPYSDTI